MSPQGSSTFLLRRRALKRAKTELQTIVMKNFYPLFAESEDKFSVVQLVQQLTDLTNRQIYKWMWDEEIRRRSLDPEECDKLVAESQTAYRALVDFFVHNCPLRQVYVLKTIFVPRSEPNSRQNAVFVALKLRQLPQDTLLFIRN